MRICDLRNLFADRPLSEIERSRKVLIDPHHVAAGWRWTPPSSEGGKPFYAAKNVVFAISSVVNARSFSVGRFRHSIFKPAFKIQHFFTLLPVVYSEKLLFHAAVLLIYKYNEYRLQHHTSFSSNIVINLTHHSPFNNTGFLNFRCWDCSSAYRCSSSQEQLPTSNSLYCNTPTPNLIFIKWEVAVLGVDMV